jgi:putative transposase
MENRRFGSVGSGSTPFATKSILERHVDYIHFNPVKHSLVTRVRDWPYSSFHRFVRRGILPQDWAGDSGQYHASFGERKR